MTDQTIQTEELVRVEGLTKVFGRHHKRAAELFRAGKTREEVYKATQCSIGVHNVSFTIRRGELFVVMGLSGQRQKHADPHHQPADRAVGRKDFHRRHGGYRTQQKAVA